MIGLPPLPPRFLPLDPYEPIRFYQRNLPHWRREGATYFITFHTRDSLPQEALADLRALRERWLATNPPPHDDERLLELSRWCGR